MQGEPVQHTGSTLRYLRSAVLVYTLPITTRKSRSASSLSQFLNIYQCSTRSVIRTKERS